MLSSTADQADLDAPMRLSTPMDGARPAYAAIQGGGQAVDGAASNPEVGTTYLALFRFVPGATTMVSAWILTSGQYDQFVVGGLSESSLDGASIGLGDADVWGRVSISATRDLGSRSFLGLFSYLGRGNLAETMDELRLSNASLAEAAPSTSAVPEPSSLVLAGVAGLAGIGSARLRRRAV